MVKGIAKIFPFPERELYLILNENRKPCPYRLMAFLGDLPWEILSLSEGVPWRQVDDFFHAFIEKKSARDAIQYHFGVNDPRDIFRKYDVNPEECPSSNELYSLCMYGGDKLSIHLGTVLLAILLHPHYSFHEAISMALSPLVDTVYSFQEPDYLVPIMSSDTSFTVKAQRRVVHKLEKSLDLGFLQRKNALADPLSHRIGYIRSTRTNRTVGCLLNSFMAEDIQKITHWVERMGHPEREHTILDGIQIKLSLRPTLRGPELVAFIAIANTRLPF